jgi:TrmH family RNA methyltransferase
VADEGSSDAGVVDIADRALRAGARVFELTKGTMERVADTVTPQPVCAVMGLVDVPFEEVLGEADIAGSAVSGGLAVVCIDVRDPGNLGVLMRSAAGSGALAVVCTPGTVDPFNPKTVRASAGAIFQVSLARAPGVGETLDRLRSAGFRLVATVARGGVDYSAADWSGRVALLLGNEASGLPADVVERADSAVTVPMAAGTESLNVAMTGTVLCFEASRQARAAASPDRPPRP